MADDNGTRPERTFVVGATLPVLDERNRLVGLVTEADLAASYFSSPARRPTTPGDGAMMRGTRTVADLMHTSVTTVTSDSSIPDAAAVMLGARQRCVPVVDGGLVVGIVSWRDLVTLLTSR
ncbi:CBS domain protein [Prauserella shujinwangii]|uniref:CBS domain protein n=1 Tax=Prauserella shujinwangii TaxID=1453103 RepID=A0A2T0LPP6_9PSEU|nr:CBS domain-containing protein [Prauserella shujinwangii]PRX45203.1 CBS domain protein [Prauserella shujinwangii]